MSIIKRVLLWLQSAFYVMAGANHFINPDFYLPMMPPWLPWPSLLHLAAGAIEIALGVLLLIPRSRRLAAWGVILLLLAVYPANIHIARNPQLFPDVPTAFHGVRLALQFVLIAWAWWFTREDSTASRSGHSRGA